MKKKKKISDSFIEMTHLVMPNQTNPLGTIFGGVVMSWIDLAAGMCAMKHSQSSVVTAHVDDIDFLRPILVGHIVTVKASINYVGKTSMIVGVKVSSENHLTGEVFQATRAYLTFVAIDAERNKVEVPGILIKTAEEKRRYENAKARVESRRLLRPLIKKGRVKKA